MKFLAFADLHEDKAVLKELVQCASQPDVDFIVCCGDISAFGRGLKYNLNKLSSVGKKIYLIPGNHEEKGLDEAISGFSCCINLHRKAIEIGDYVFLGYGGNSFVQEDAEFRKIARRWYGLYKKNKTVLVTHAPPLGTKLDLLKGIHVGNRDYRRFIERMKPQLVVSGHLHETVGEMDKIGETKLVNPGWEGMIVELS